MNEIRLQIDLSYRQIFDLAEVHSFYFLEEVTVFGHHLVHVVFVFPERLILQRLNMSKTFEA